MAGETVKTTAICLSITPWSKTSHIVGWLTPTGRVMTVVKGAERPKSAFLGQYDLNYTCETVYYARARGDLHALRACAPLESREWLRGDFRALALAGYFRLLAARLSPQGTECGAWYELLETALDGLHGVAHGAASLGRMLDFELRTLHLLGLKPELEAVSGAFVLRGERAIPVSSEVVACIRRLPAVDDLRLALDTARAIGVYYEFHVDSVSEARRSVLRVLST